MRFAKAAPVVLAVAACSTSEPAECPGTPGRFHDCLAASGIVAGPPYVFDNGAAIGDLDEDGLPDVVTFNFGAPVRVFRNRGGLRFAVVGDTGLDVEGASGLRLADLDGDGRLDLVATEFLGVGADLRPKTQRLRVFAGLGGMRFEDRTAAWGFDRVPDLGNSLLLGVDLADVNGDGLLDVAPRRHADPTAGALLWLSEPGPHWSEAGRPVLGDVAGNAFATLFLDVNGDGFEDALVVNDQAADRPPSRLLLRTPGALRFTDDDRLLPAYFGADAKPGDLMAAVPGDFDADGRLDLYLTDIGAQHLLRRTENGLFAEAGTAAHAAIPAYPDGGRTVAYSPAFADFTNDGLPDLLVPASTDRTNLDPPVPFFLENKGDGTFVDRSSVVRGSGSISEQAISVADLDGDGRLDAFTGGTGRAPRLLHNLLEVPTRAVTLKLRGNTSNRDGIGARVLATTGGRTVAWHLNASGAPYGDSPRELHLGTGTASAVDSVRIQWPSGAVQFAGPFASPGTYTVEEPPFVALSKTLAAEGEPVVLTIEKPAGATSVEAVLEPEGTSIPLESLGNSRKGPVVAGPGLHGIRITIDGRPLPARPQLVVR